MMRLMLSLTHTWDGSGGILTQRCFVTTAPHQAMLYLYILDRSEQNHIHIHIHIHVMQFNYTSVMPKTVLTVLLIISFSTTLVCQSIPDTQHLPLLHQHQFQLRNSHLYYFSYQTSIFKYNFYFSKFSGGGSHMKKEAQQMKEGGGHFQLRRVSQSATNAGLVCQLRFQSQQYRNTIPQLGSVCATVTYFHLSQLISPTLIHPILKLLCLHYKNNLL